MLGRTRRGGAAGDLTTAGAAAEALIQRAQDRRPVRYAVVATVVGLALGATIAVRRIFPYFVGDFFYVAIAASSWFLGLDAALASLALSVAAVAWLTPETPFPSVDDVLYLSLFGLTATTMLRLSEGQRRARRIAEARAEEAREANEAKDRFLDLVSHELRGPLHGIRLWLRIASRERFDPASVERACASIENCVRQQARLVGDLLDAARVRAGTIALEMRETTLRPVLARAAEMVAPAAEAKGLLLGPAEGDLDLPVLADPDRLAQVVWNLLLNAVKFTDRGRVEIVARHRGGSVEVHVRDTGRGLSNEECARVFRPYWQRERGDGLGLGLMIAQRLVTLHGGDLSVVSAGPGRGADFVVSLPVAAGAAEARVRQAG